MIDGSLLCFTPPGPVDEVAEDHYILYFTLMVLRLFLRLSALRGELLTPVALAHWIQGDGKADRSGLVLCTDSFTIQEVVLLMNVLMIRYRLSCTLQMEGGKCQPCGENLYSSGFNATIRIHCSRIYGPFNAL
jgi:hypothetical protein